MMCSFIHYFHDNEADKVSTHIHLLESVLRTPGFKLLQSLDSDKLKILTWGFWFFLFCFFSLGFLETFSLIMLPESLAWAQHPKPGPDNISNHILCQADRASSPYAQSKGQRTGEISRCSGLFWTFTSALLCIISISHRRGWTFQSRLGHSCHTSSSGPWDEHFPDYYQPSNFTITCRFTLLKCAHLCLCWKKLPPKYAKSLLLRKSYLILKTVRPWTQQNIS